MKDLYEIAPANATLFQLTRSINHPNIKLQLDLFHLQQVDGNLTRNIEAMLPYVGHIQIAQVRLTVKLLYIYKRPILLTWPHWPHFRFRPAASRTAPARWTTATCWGCWRGWATVGTSASSTLRWRTPSRGWPGSAGWDSRINCNQTTGC